MGKNLKRISLHIREEQYKSLANIGLNLSGLIRDLIDDHLSEHKITLAVSEETRNLYDLVISNTGSSDQEMEKYLTQALKQLLTEKIIYMQKLQKSLERK